MLYMYYYFYWFWFGCSSEYVNTCDMQEMEATEEMVEVIVVRVFIQKRTYTWSRLTATTTMS